MPQLQHNVASLLLQLLAKLSPQAELQEYKMRSWASITFHGARHEVRLSLPDEASAKALAKAIAGEPTDPGALLGHIICDVVVHSDRPDDFRFEVLTVEA